MGNNKKDTGLGASSKRYALRLAGQRPKERHSRRLSLQRSAPSDTHTPQRCFDWDDNPGRRSITRKLSSEEADRKAMDLARAEQEKPEVGN